MHVTVAILLALQCTLCLTIRVPITWNNENSAVNKNNQFRFEQFQPQNAASSNQKPISSEFFQYAGQKPKFAVDIAKIHGVQSPDVHYKAYSIKPHTGVPKPELGKHQIFNKENNIFHPLPASPKKNEAIRVVTPSKTNYQVFHPYNLEEPALKELYQDPTMDKIRNDLENNKLRLQKYENEPGQSDITEGEYLERPEDTDRKKLPHKNVPAPYEIHRPQHRPVYYTAPFVHNQREQVLNQKLRHPLHQNHIKVKPIHYQPVKNHLHKLRQQHALKYDDERNEYPQLPIPEKQSELPEGYDIYEKGKEKFVQLRNNVDESLNETVQKNKHPEKQKLELIDDEYDEGTSSYDEDEDDFVPIKNYAQVRKTETTKHLPKEAAYEDADTLEEIQNAPRLREAIKSTKAQTVYSEEGYEDSAYDHAGEQKHASDHEEHRGLLKQKERSNGKYKSPSFAAKYEEEEGSEYGDQVLDGKKWKDTRKNTEKETDLEEFSEKEDEDSEESDSYTRQPKNNKEHDVEVEDEAKYNSREEEIKRIKREPAKTDDTNMSNKSSNLEKNKDQGVELITEIPTINKEQKTENENDKYPYYHNKFKGISKDSPLRYAENLKFIPNKSEGGTEFYDSRAKFECPKVEDNIDPIPEKLKKDGHPDDDEEGELDDIEGKKEGNVASVLNKTPRLRGLGDKIDCFKAKYFGENPLDSPFFKEEIIANPEPVTIPSIDIYRLKQAKQKKSTQNSELRDEIILEEETKEIENKENNKKANLTLTKTKPAQSVSLASDSVSKLQNDLKSNSSSQIQVQPEKDGLKYLNILRKKRAAPFVYEPYKIIRDSQIQDSKKTTTTNNISPLIKQLQSSRVVDKVATNTGKEQIVKRSAGIRPYKDIGKSEREKKEESKGSQPLYDASFVDVSVDQRRGEPRYELRTANHKAQYSPVENKRSMTMDDYKTQTKSDIKTSSQEEDKSHNKRKPNRRRRTTTTRPYFDVSKFLPQEENDKSDKVNVKSKIMTNQPILSSSEQSDKSIENKDAENDDSKQKSLKTSSTTTRIPSRTKKIDSLTTVKPETDDELPLADLPKLRLITRFKNSYQTETPVTPKRLEIPSLVKEDGGKITVPKYREKKKKISKSTLVTDTNSYGEDDDDEQSKEEEVDALIGVKHDIEEYIPSYEIEGGKRDTSSDGHSESQDGDEGYEEDNHRYGDDDDESDDDDEDDDDDDDDEVEEDQEDEEDEETEIEEDSTPEITTHNPIKGALTKTTEAPLTTTEARSAKLKIEPVIITKMLDIHKELPVNRSSPHVTEFKQDIKEIEVVKEIPSRKRKIPQKNIEALELYKDENLAKDINKLGGVEVFKEGLDLRNGPKHGGNYRIAEIISTERSPSTLSSRRQIENSSKGDVEASPSKTSKIIDIKNDSYSRRRSDILRARNNRNKNAKLIELTDSTDKPTSRSMHGGNFKSIHDMRRRGGNRNSKLIELVDVNNRDDHSTNKHDGSSRSYGSRGGDRHQMHGGNYRSAKLVKTDDKVRTQTENVPKKDLSTDIKQNSADLLDSFARAVTVVTTPTPFILDPSKRMYYYVEA